MTDDNTVQVHLTTELPIPVCVYDHLRQPVVPSVAPVGIVDIVKSSVLQLLFAQVALMVELACYRAAVTDGRVSYSAWVCSF